MHRFAFRLVLILTVLTACPAAWALDEVPSFDPLAGFREVVDINPAANAEIEVAIPRGDGLETREIQGDAWYYTYSGDELPTMIAALKAFAEAQGAELLRDDEFHLLLRKDAGNGVVWWCKGRFENGLDLAVVRTLRLDPGRTVSFPLAGEERVEVRFFTDNPGGRYRSLTVTLPSGECYLEAEEILRAGAYRREIAGKWSLNGGRAQRFAIDGLPQEAGVCHFILSTNPGSDATAVSVTLNEHPYPVPKVRMGEKLGALRIRNVPYGLARIRAVNRFGAVHAFHPEFPDGTGFENGDVTPEGDAYFLMPAGLWQVEVLPTSLKTATAVRAQFVPVHSGRETVLDWPLAMTSVFAAEGGNGLAVNAVERKGNHVDATFSLYGPDAEGMVPLAADLTVREGGSPARVVSVERTRLPLDIVLLVDSSGSMKGQMRNALDATRKFIAALPADARVRVVDFDTKPRALPGETRDAALKGLAGIKANGATCLNDAVLLGLHMLAGAKRPALLVFTDGFDANFNDTGPGSKATRREVLDAVKTGGVPVFTIGFGKGHDVSTLDRIASLSGGRYYPASDPGALDKAFAVVNANLANTFTARYERPTRGRPSNVPVVTCMVDISGSMDKTPDFSGCNYRMDKVKAILHDFLAALPDEVLAQGMTFSDQNVIEQVTTANTGEMLAAMNDLYADGGTEIAGAVAAVLETQRAIPSTRRYLLFITDAALDVEPEDKLFFETTLAKLRDEGVYCLWVGIGELDPAPFKRAAEISGGSYVLTEDPAELGRAFDGLVADIRKPVPSGDAVRTMVELTVRHRLQNGRNLTFAGADQTELPPLKTDDTVEIPAAIGYELAELRERYDPAVSALLTGDGVPVRDARITKRIPIGVTGGNKAAKFTVESAWFLDRLRGLDAPDHYRYLALAVDLQNVLPKQQVLVYPDGSNHPAAWVGNDKATTGKVVEMVPTYVIPDLKRHLFLRWNDAVMTPVSPATWLAETPLTLPDEPAVAVPPKETVRGTVVFLVPDGNMRQLSLHFYDVNYGHAEIPLVGAMPTGADRLSTLPAKPPVRLSDAFSLAVREVRDVTRIGAVQAEEGGVFRVVEADFTSKVQALLDVNPAERFSLRLNTAEGALNVRLHEATALLPMGFYAPTLLSPGSNNRVRLVFRVPGDVAGEAGKGELVVDVKGGGVVVPLDERAAKAVPRTAPDDALKGDGVALVVNGLAPLPDRENLYVADLTLFDQKDGKATQLVDAFILRNRNFTPGPGFEPPPLDWTKSKGLAGFAADNALIPVGTMPPALDTADLVFGVTDETIVPDGGSLRGLILFSLPPSEPDPAAWDLTSPLFPDLKQPVGDEPYPEGRLLVRRQGAEQPYGEGSMVAFEEAVAELARQRAARRFEKPGAYRPKATDLDGDAPPVRAVAVPEITDPAQAEFADIKTLKALKARLKTVRCLPADLGEWRHLFAPQAVLVQNWGGPADFARMAELVLARQGVKTRRLSLELTDRGRQALARLAGLERTDAYAVPALEYRDADGNKHVLVAPFLETEAKLPGLIRKVADDDPSAEPMTASVTVSVLARPVQTGQARAGRELSDALSGESDAGAPVELHLLTASPSLPALSRGAVDLGFTLAGYGNGPVIKAIFDGNDGRVIGADAVDTGDYVIVAERLSITLNQRQLVLELPVDENESLTDRYHCLGLNLPDMDMDAVRKLDKTMRAVHKLEDAPDNLSALRWYARNRLYRFVCAQSEYERSLAGTLKLTVGRTTTPRCLIATVSRTGPDQPVRTALDLRQAANQVQPAPGTNPEAVRAFNILSGLFASQLEAKVLGPDGVGFYQLLPRYPADTRFLWLTADARAAMAEDLKKAVPDRVFRLLNQSRATVLFPDQPAILDGRPRWAWLEVDPDTYRTIAVLDTGERGGMVERVFSDLWKQGLDYVTGGLVGISSSIWSVSAFSLVLDDYKQIMTEAKKFALGLADNFSASVKVGDFQFKGAVGSSQIETTYTGAGAGAVNAAKTGKGWYDKLKEPKIDLGGFEGGFKDGVNFYFSQAGG
ncbi:von Willebrand factor type A [Pseudodesulfovibrio mercurii]|uniref:von Willebrand factor type A n=1 Tax=Pseudodesulfovibrio mercurii TaxID=641491 RepID=F0JBR4_9BACT|nr:VWA domain-containing protein [Pseudodesulfovibrio mercurii]EGB15567.1 von Willebrand factor type A [Pseudodesulfovibrio mercurii]